MLYAFLFDREPKEGRQMFTAANDKSQASIVFNMVAKQLMYEQKTNQRRVFYRQKGDK